MEKKRMGRPPKAAEDRAGPAVQFRVRGEVKAEIERQALLAGRSISEECEFRLTRSVQRQAALAEMFGDPEHGPLMLAIGNVVRLTSGSAEDKAPAQVRAAVIRLIEELSEKKAAAVLEEAAQAGDEWSDAAARVALLEKGLLKSLADIMGR